jgi:hypothetical protein
LISGRHLYCVAAQRVPSVITGFCDPARAPAKITAK